MRYFLAALLFGIAICAQAELHLGLGKMTAKKSVEVIEESSGGQRYPIYPNTTALPSFNSPFLPYDNAALATDITLPHTFGKGEGDCNDSSNINDEFEVHLIPATIGRPIRAITEGTVTRLSLSGAPFNDDYLIAVRYGQNFVIGYDHVVNINPALKLGGRVERGDLIGRVRSTSGGYYEIRLMEQRGTKNFYALNLYSYAGLSASDKNQLTAAWNSHPGHCPASTPWGDLSEIYYQDPSRLFLEFGY